MWTPHLLLGQTAHPQTGTTGTTGEALYELGKMLLELAWGIPLNLHGLSDWERKVAMDGALGDISQMMGVRYRDIVDRYMCLWSVKDFDLLDSTILGMFLSDILLFETLAHGYPQTKYPTISVTG